MGILLIACGILIAIFPALLSFIVSALLILLGIFVLLIANEYRQHARRLSITTINTIFRY
jgi:hypothetical protein